VDVLAARRELSQARYTQLETRATLLESTAALAFASAISAATAQPNCEDHE